MKKPVLYCALTLCAAVGAGWARAWQRASAFEPGTGLLTPHAPATLWLVAALCGAAALALLLARWAAKGADFRSYLSAFALPGRGWLILYLAAGGLLLVGGLVGIRDHQTNLVTQLSRYIFSIALLPTGLSVALVGWLNAQRQEGSGRFAWPLLLPGWCGCIWLIAAYQAHTATPNAMAFAPYFLGAVCAVGGCYFASAFSFERPRPVWCLWLCALAPALLATAVVDGVQTGDYHRVLVCLGYGLYLAAQGLCLAWRCGHSADLTPWKPPARLKKDEDGTETKPAQAETEVSEHE